MKAIDSNGMTWNIYPGQSVRLTCDLAGAFNISAGTKGEVVEVFGTQVRVRFGNKLGMLT